MELPILSLIMVMLEFAPLDSCFPAHRQVRRRNDNFKRVLTKL